MLFDLVEESKKIIQIRSDGDQGNRRLVEHLLPFCRQMGFSITLQTPENGQGDREANLIAHSADANALDLCPNGLVFVTHLDTVPAGEKSLWTKTASDPFNATVEENRIYGLGSADTKLDFLCKLLAVEKVGLKNLKIPFALIGTFGEEKSLTGARLIRDSGRLHPKWALIGEPSELKAVIAHKGILYAKAFFKSARVPEGKEIKEVDFKGKAAHGSTPHLGENAIGKAVEWLKSEEKAGHFWEPLHISGGTVHNIVPEKCTLKVQKVSSPGPRFAFLKEFSKRLERAREYLQTHANTDFNPPHTTDNVGVIRTSSDGALEIEFDFRLIPETDGNVLWEIFQSLSKEISGAQVLLVRSNAPMRTSPKSEIAARVSASQEEVGLTPAFAIKAGNTEGAIFNEMGAESIVIGPGLSTGNIHAPNEYNEISQMKKAVEFYAAFLRRFC